MKKTYTLTIENDQLPLEALEEQVALPLVQWYRDHKRTLPWREQMSPYGVWVSEIMLQQTRVAAVIPYYQRFMEALPTIGHLATVEDGALLKLWEGLGYYSRVRNMKKAAIAVMEQFDGELPADYEALRTLPGIGEYTAGAIASIAFGLPVPAVDGNVLRIFARVLGVRDDIGLPQVKAAFTRLLMDKVPKRSPGDFNQGLMDLGATICLPGGAPDCGRCPIFHHCFAFWQNQTASLPYKAPKKARKFEEKTVILPVYQGGILLRKRPETGLLAGMWEYPSFPGHLTAAEVLRQAALLGLCPERAVPLPDAKHIFTHIEWDMRGYLLELGERPSLPLPYSFVSGSALKEELAVPSAFKAYTPIALAHLGCAF